MEALTRLRARQTEITSSLEEIDKAADGARFSDAQTAEWNELNEEFEENRAHISELEAREQVISDRARAGSVEAEKATPSKFGKKQLVPDDPTDLLAYRQMTSNIDDYNRGLKEGALKLVERMRPANREADVEGTQERVDHLIRHVDSASDPELSRRIIATSSERYMRAFGKVLSGAYLEQDEQRALSLTAGSGGYAVPVTLDPTIIMVGTGAINPVRQYARTVTITGNTWEGISSTGVVASYDAEATEVSDDAPTLVQPSAIVEKAQAFIPYSIEIGEDWASLQSEMARLLYDAKTVLESNKFLKGIGHASTEPLGLIAPLGATAVVTTATTAVFAIADVYSLEAALNPRFRARASFAGSKAAFQKIRQFDTSGGAGLWTQLRFGDPADLIGYPAWEWSDYSGGVTTSGSTIMTFGDFSQFLVVDRVGMNIETISHLFATANNRPSGQRGLYAYWRNTSMPLTPALGANSAFVSLKVL